MTPSQATNRLGTLMPGGQRPMVVMALVAVSGVGRLTVGQRQRSRLAA
jgi:hypothetical protein